METGTNVGNVGFVKLALVLLLDLVKPEVGPTNTSTEAQGFDEWFHVLRYEMMS